MNKWLYGLCCVCWLNLATAQYRTFQDSKGNAFRLHEQPAGKARVYLFLSPECPLCQSYTLTIRNLHATFAKQGIEMIGIVPGTDFSNTDMLLFQRKYKLPIPMLRDERLVLVKQYQATITPEVVVVNAQGQVVYQGRIDNWAYELGKKRKVITEHNLRDVLQAILNHTPIAVTRTKAVGCYIE